MPTLNVVRRLAARTGLKLAAIILAASPLTHAFADTYSGVIAVTESNVVVGYVDATPGNKKQFVITPNLGSALNVTFNDSSNPFSISVTNPVNAADPYFGADVGPASTNNNLSSGSYNYAFLNETAGTAPGSAPQSGSSLYGSGDIESAIWSFDPVSDVLTAQWINTNLSSPTTYEVNYYSQGLFLVGDVATFTGIFGPVTPVGFEFVGTDTSSAAPVPEPSSLALLGTGIAGVFGVARRRFRS